MVKVVLILKQHSSITGVYCVAFAHPISSLISGVVLMRGWSYFWGGLLKHGSTVFILAYKC